VGRFDLIAIIESESGLWLPYLFLVILHRWLPLIEQAIKNPFASHLDRPHCDRMLSFQHRRNGLCILNHMLTSLVKIAFGVVMENDRSIGV
jgi:hypothetical protein